MSAQRFRRMLPVFLMVTAACGGSTDVGIARADGAAPLQESGARSTGAATDAGGHAGGSATGGVPGHPNNGGTGGTATSHDAGWGGVTDTSTGNSGAGRAIADSGVLGAGGGGADGGTADAEPTDGGGVLHTDADLDVIIPEPTCSLTAVFSTGLAGAWDCAIDPACAPAPPHDASTTCRESPEPRVFLYRSRECWEQWHPGRVATVDFSREIVATVCTWRDNTEQLVFEGVAGCGAEATVKARTVGTCTQEGTSDCPYTSFGVVLPVTVRLVHWSIAETQLPPVVQLDGGGFQCISIEPPACGDPSNPANDACWRSCGLDADCTLVETNTCGCAGEGQRVAIRNQLATQWQISSIPCALTDGSRCDDCSAGYVGARAACDHGFCTVTCDGNVAGGCPSTACPCAPGLFACSGSCVDLLSDTNNCGGCGKVCPFLGGGRGCFQGICSETGACPGCGATLCDCDGLAANGCETKLASDPLNCGTCGLVCGGGQTCVSGVCR